MVWARLDDRFPWHPKVRPLTDAAFRLHVSAICWIAENLTDGVVEEDRLRYISDVRSPRKAVAQLLQHGLWELHPDGWLIHDWDSYLPHREEVAAKRQAEADKKRAQRRKALGLSPGDDEGDSPGDSPALSPRDIGSSNGQSPPGTPPGTPPGDSPARARARGPVPTRPDPSSGSLVETQQLADARDKRVYTDRIRAARTRAASGGEPMLDGWDVDACNRAAGNIAQRHGTTVEHAHELIDQVANLAAVNGPQVLTDRGAYDRAQAEYDRIHRDDVAARRDAKRLADSKRHAAAVDAERGGQQARAERLALDDPDGWERATQAARAALEAGGKRPLAPLVRSQALALYAPP